MMSTSRKGWSTLATLLATGDGILAGYAASDEDARARAEATRRHDREVIGMVRALPPDTTEPGQIARRVEAWRSAGADAVDTYNYGFMPRWALRELYDALR